MPHGSEVWVGDRRALLRGALRVCALGALGTVGWLARSGRGRQDGETCIADGICSRCRAQTSCGLPQALSMRAARHEGQTHD